MGNQTKNALLAIAIGTAVASCAVTPENASRATDSALCAGLGEALRSERRTDAELLHAEAEKRRLLSGHGEYDLIARKSIKVGMSQCAMYASWGMPTKENRTVSRGSTAIQHVYGTYYFGRYVSSRPTYVYTRNGRVSAWQD